TEILTDLAVFSNEDLKHLAVDTVVTAIQGDDLHPVAFLAVAVDAALPLVMAGWIPGQVVVDDGVEIVLEINPLGQAVGGHQDATCTCSVLRLLSGFRGKLLDTLHALLR